MIVWRGAGIVVLGGIGIGWLASELLRAVFGIPDEIGFPLGLVLAGVGLYFLGYLMNIKGPQREMAEDLAHTRLQIDSLITQGRFHGGPAFPFPRSIAEARQQADWVLEQRAIQLKALRNRHTFFFVPVQWAGVAMSAIAAVILLLQLVG